jgi:hypothetical protein
MDDRNGSCGSLGGLGCWRCDYYDDVDIQSNHLVRKFLEAIRIALCIPALDDEVPTLLVPEFPEAPEQGLIKSLVSVCDKPYPPNLARLLGLRT